MSTQHLSSPRCFTLLQECETREGPALLLFCSCRLPSTTRPLNSTFRDVHQPCISLWAGWEVPKGRDTPVGREGAHPEAGKPSYSQKPVVFSSNW